MRVSLEEQVVAVKQREPDPTFDGVSDEVLVEGFAREASAIARGARRPTVRVGRSLRGLRTHSRPYGTYLPITASQASPRARPTAERRGSKVRAIVSTHRPELDAMLVQFAEVASGQQLHRICAQFNTSDTGPIVDTWAARDLSMRELSGGMSELRVVPRQHLGSRIRWAADVRMRSSKLSRRWRPGCRRTRPGTTATSWSSTPPLQRWRSRRPGRTGSSRSPTTQVGRRRCPRGCYDA